MSRQIIAQGGKPGFVVIPIDEWRRIEAALPAPDGDETFPLSPERQAR